MALFLYLYEWNAHRAAVHTEYIYNSVIIKIYQHNASCNDGCGGKKSPVEQKTDILFGGQLCKPGDDFLTYEGNDPRLFRIKDG